MPPLVDALGVDAVASGLSVSPDYGTDESLHAEAQLPEAVVFPADTTQVAAVVRLAAERRVPITARGAGTGLSGGCIPLPGGLVVSFARMGRLLEIDTANHVAVVQPGLTLAELDEATAVQGLVFPCLSRHERGQPGGQCRHPTPGGCAPSNTA